MTAMPIASMRPCHSGESASGTVAAPNQVRYKGIMCSWPSRRQTNMGLANTASESIRNTTCSNCAASNTGTSLRTMPTPLASAPTTFDAWPIGVNELVRDSAAADENVILDCGDHGVPDPGQAKPANSSTPAARIANTSANFLDTLIGIGPRATG
jgi:hypothetical protein